MRKLILLTLLIYLLIGSVGISQMFYGNKNNSKDGIYKETNKGVRYYHFDNGNDSFPVHHFDIFEYDRFGKLIKKDSFNEDGKPKKTFRTIFEYDDDKMTKETNYDENGNLVNDVYGVCKIVTKYNKKGEPIRIEKFNKDGEHTNDNNGISVLIKEYNNKGDIIEDETFDKDGNRTNQKYSKYSFVYCNYKEGKNGNLIEEKYFYKSNEDLKSRTVRLIDSDNKVMEETFYDSLDSFSLKCKYVFNKDGKIVKRTFHDRKGRISNNPFGVGEIIFEYGDNTKEVKYYDRDRIPVENLFGIHKYFTKYDSNKKVIEQKYFDKNQNYTPYTNYLSEPEHTITKYEKNNLTEIKSYIYKSKFDKLEKIPVYKLIIKYDKNNLITEVTENDFVQKFGEYKERIIGKETYVYELY